MQQDPRVLPAPGSSIVPVAFRPSVFRQDREHVTARLGTSLAEIVAEWVPERELWHLLRVSVDGWDIHQERWALIRPKRQVEVVIVPAGGGNTLRIVLAVAIIAVAVAAGAWIAAPAGLAAGSLGATGAAAAGAVATAAISTAGFLAMNALIPMETPGVEGDQNRMSPFYALDKASNQLWKYRPVPVMLGRMRITPPLGAEIRTETVGDQSYLNGIFVWSQGEVVIGNPKIGDIDLGALRNVEHQFVQASLTTAPAFTNYTRDVHEERVELQLTKSGGWMTRRAQDGATKIEIEIWFLRGLIGIGKKTQDQFSQSVEIEVQVRAVGTTTWTTVGRPQWEETTTQTVRKSFSCDVAAGNWEVRVQRRTNDSNEDRLVNDSWWGLLRSFRPSPPVLAKFVAASNLRVLGTDQIHGTLDDFSAECASVCLDWDADTHTWIKRMTNVPASLFRYILQFPTQPYRLTDDEIDLPTLQEWHEYCTSRGLTCNVYYDWGGTTDEALALVARCGRATPIWRDGKRSVMWDRQQTIYRQRFTPRNVRDFRCTRTFTPDTHGYRVRFRNQNQNWKPDERIVYFDGYNEANASRFEELDAAGITTPAAAWRFGRWSYGQVKLRPETYTFRTDFEYLAATRGDLVEIQHDAISVGAGAGRIMSVQRVDNLIRSITLDERIPFDPSESYAAVLHVGDGGRLEFPIINPNGPSKLLELETPFENGWPAPGDLVLVGVRGMVSMPAIIRDIEPSDDLSAELTCVPAAWFDENEPIPDFNSRLTNPPGLTVPIITSIRSDDTAATRDADGSIRVQLVLSFYNDGSRTEGAITAIEVVLRDTRSPNGAGQYFSAPAESTEMRFYSVQVDATYSIAARYRFSTGRAGAWSAAKLHTVVGPSLPPADVTVVYLDSDVIRVRYDNPDPDHAGFRWRWTATPGTSWDNCETLTDAIVVETYIDVAALPLATREVLVRAETRSGLLSATPGRLQIQPGSLIQRLRLYDEQLGGDGIFPGVIEGGDLGPDNALEADDSGLWLDPPDATWLADPLAVWLQPTWKRLAWITSTRMRPEARSTDRIFLACESSETPRIIYRWGDDALVIVADEDVLPDEFLDAADDALLGTISSEETLHQWRAYRNGIAVVPGERLQVQVSIPGGGSGTRPTITRLTLIVDAPEIEEVISDQPIPAAGLVVPVAKPMRGIRYVVGTIHAGGDATSMLIDSKALPPDGPVIHLENTSRERVAGTVDLRVGGV